jgi:hypothetical protein
VNHAHPTSVTLMAGSTLAVVVAGCAWGGRVGPATNRETVGATSTIAVDQVLTFNAPPDLKETPIQGIDSLVKAYRSPTIELSLDYGLYSDPLNGTDKPGHTRSEATIDGRKAYIVAYENVIALHVPHVSQRNHNRLTMFARCSDARAREDVQRLFRSIRFR